MLILALIQDQALVASKHHLIETKEKPPVDSAVDHGSKNLLPEELKEKDDEGIDEEDSSEDGNDYFWHWGSRWGSQCPQGMHFSWGRGKCVSHCYYSRLTCDL